MKIVSLSDLNRTAFSIGGITSIYQTPTYRGLTNPGRVCNGFLLIEKGECLYQWADERVTLCPDALIYLPYGSRHKLTVLSDDIAFTRVDFTLTDTSGETVIFSEGPLLITHQVSQNLSNSIHQLTVLFFQSNEALQRTILLCTVLHEITQKYERKFASRIAPVIEYIAKHYCEEIDCSCLSELCYLSKAQMYRLFQAEMGCSPIKYRNRLRVEHACQLLFAKECSIGEIASMLGFDSIYYFSREFKRQIGVPPSEFRQKSAPCDMVRGTAD